MDNKNRNNNYGSKDVVRAAITIAMTETREEEDELKKQYKEKGIKTVAVSYGGEFINSVMKIVERAVVSAKRENVIKEIYSEEGAVAGAAREALSQVMTKAIGLNVGGKISVARYNQNICVAVFFGIGLLHLNEISIGIGHRAVS